MVVVANVSEWVRAAAAGETTAWNTLYRKYYPGMYAIALRICRDSDAATDAVQDGFVSAYLKLSQLNDPENFGGWLRQIVTHTCYRTLSRQKNTVYLESLPSENESFWEDEINRKFDQLSTQSRLYSAMAKLPDALHSTLILRYFSTFQSYEEIAAILGVPVGTVRSRLNQARLKLLEQWNRHQDANEREWRESEEWNDYYQAMYGGMHTYDACKTKLLTHLQHSQIVFTTGKSYAGGQVLEKMVEEDRQVGSWLKPVTIFSSGIISVIEAVHFNSSEHPNHCPPASVTVIHRKDGKASRVVFHLSEK
ncbi:RNA polymerase sigma factor [Larkinella sp. GY13]|jgi:RNA polymerase sigma factor (sigma-70 family)|uniref:RNA polymerase sigma factor n=1 Tax=Larkinella sp. GY13 TaxID=3453720 RepID=UPI003EE86B37